MTSIRTGYRNFLIKSLEMAEFSPTFSIIILFVAFLCSLLTVFSYLAIKKKSNKQPNLNNKTLISKGKMHEC